MMLLLILRKMSSFIHIFSTTVIR